MRWDTVVLAIIDRESVLRHSFQQPDDTDETAPAERRRVAFRHST